MSHTSFTEFWKQSGASHLHQSEIWESWWFSGNYLNFGGESQISMKIAHFASFLGSSRGSRGFPTMLLYSQKQVTTFICAFRNVWKLWQKILVDKCGPKKNYQNSLDFHFDLKGFRNFYDIGDLASISSPRRALWLGTWGSSVGLQGSKSL